ncbi:MAG: hypothetical protein IT372_39635 [Polyangiaceae bacterium]|nr:hypothetical protein [Polyangiaceae bacterium]
MTAPPPRRRRIAAAPWIALGLCLGCQASGPGPRLRPSGPRAAAPPEGIAKTAATSDAPATEGRAAAPRRARRCGLVDVPPPPPAPPPAGCNPPAPAIARAVTARLARAYEPERVGGKPVVTFACDGLGPEIASAFITIDTGSDLDLWHVTREAESRRYAARGIRFDDPLFDLPREPGDPDYRVSTAVLDRSTFEPRLSEVRAALAAEIREEAPPDAPHRPRTVRLCGSTYWSIVLVDTEGRRLVKTMNVGPGPGLPESLPGIRIAQEGLAPVTALPWERGAPTDDDHAFFSARFNESMPAFDEEPHVMAGFVSLARYFGDAAIIPGLIARLTPRSPARRELAARDDALEALARITGWDARRDEQGRARSPELAAAAILEECSAAVSP